MREVSPSENYIQQVYGSLDPDLARIREELKQRDLDFMAISSHEARVLQFLIRGFGVKKIVEIGTLFGFSALSMAKALPSDGQIFSLEKSRENHAIAKEMIAKSLEASKIELLCGDAVSLLKDLSSSGPFDMVFIDANKAGYLDYLDWADQNVRSGGLIVGDNTFLFGALWGQSRDREVGPRQIEVMNTFNTRLADTSRYNSVIIPTTEGMTVAQKL